MTSTSRFTLMGAVATALGVAAPAGAQDAPPAPDPLGALPPDEEPAPAPETDVPAPVDPLGATPATEPAPTQAPAPVSSAASPRGTAAPARLTHRARPAPRPSLAPLPTPAIALPAEPSAPVAPPTATVARSDATPGPAAQAGDGLLPLAATAGLVLLALLGAAVALRRARRRAAEEALDEPGFEALPAAAAFAEPVREPAIRRGADLAQYDGAARPTSPPPAADTATARDSGAVVSRIRAASASNAFLFGEPLRPLPRSRPVPRH